MNPTAKEPGTVEQVREFVEGVNRASEFVKNYNHDRTLFAMGETWVPAVDAKYIESLREFVAAEVARAIRSVSVPTGGDLGALIEMLEATIAREFPSAMLIVRQYGEAREMRAIMLHSYPVLIVGPDVPTPPAEGRELKESDV